MSATSFSSSKPLLTYSLLLSQRSGDAEGQASKSVQAHAGRLYIAAAEAPQEHDSPRQDLSCAVSAVREAIKQAENRECPLPRSLLAPSNPDDVAERERVLYAESARTVPCPQPSAEKHERRPILTSCPQVIETPLQPSQCYEAATVAPLCVFHDLSERSDANRAFWDFVDGLLRHCIQEHTSDAAVAGVRGSVLSLYEGAGSEAFCVDAFAESDAQKLPGEVTGRVMAVDSGAAVDKVISHLQRALGRAEERHGSSLLVVEVMWKTLSQLRLQASSITSSSPLNERDQKACLVWLRNASDGDTKDGVYADAALEMLLDELTLAAATARTPQEAAAVLEEAGVMWFFNSCNLMRELRALLHGQFPVQCAGTRPLFHWMVCAPTCASITLNGCVTRYSFSGETAAALDDFWCAMDEVRHWRDVLAAAKAPSGSPRLPVPTDEPSAEKTRSGLLSPMGLSTFLQQNIRLSRQRRAIRQSGHQLSSASRDGSTLSRQRCKLNVPKLYGLDGRDDAQESRWAISLGSSYAASAVLHHTRSSSNSSFSGNSLLNADETIGHIPRRTARIVKRIPKPSDKDDEQGGR
ncbi:hypothetical protein ABL78_5556 [Leptomonas seymouri]|uniref:Uncharacterized protein n=1 Tax=Leptomonas seymouri TaxID=5684 RepID=A0A0N1PDF5_LEPSE|nr:hypothetical protein ABL78_5556 [Leptomonas seymouri]|eukprot:KPI85375.1 hypothetical protein ABL78_5556 [Leptomonas seymouri]